MGQLRILFLIQKLKKLKKTPDHAKYITTAEFNKISNEIKQVKTSKNSNKQRYY